LATAILGAKLAKKSHAKVASTQKIVKNVIYLETAGALSSRSMLTLADIA
jgi:hypothetical protein